MRTTHVATFAFATLAACGGGGKSNPDASKPIDAAIDAPADAAKPDAFMADLSCINDPAATTGPNPIAVAGSVLTTNAQLQQVAVEGATVNAFKVSAPTVPLTKNPAISDAAGAFTLSIPNATQKPLDGFIEASKTGLHTTRIFPPNPLSMDLPQAPIPMLSDALLAVIQQVTGIQQDPKNGAIVLGILDCKGQPIPGAMVSVKQGGNEVGQQLDGSQIQPGTFFVFNVPPNNTTIISATAMGMELHAHTVTSSANTTTATFVTPHP